MRRFTEHKAYFTNRGTAELFFDAIRRSPAMKEISRVINGYAVRWLNDVPTRGHSYGR